MPVYNAAVQKAVKTIPKPVSDLKVHIVAYPSNTLAVRVYYENIMDYPETKRMQIMEYLHKVSATLESFGFDSFVEGKGMPEKS